MVNNETRDFCIYTYGVFDIIHSGHLRLIKELLKLRGKCTYINMYFGLFTDEVAKSFKRKPILSYEERYEQLKTLLELIDSNNFVIIPQEELDPKKNIDDIHESFNKRVYFKPEDIVMLACKGTGAGFEKYAKERENYIVLPYHEGISTSEIIERIKKCK